jgi:hypothetical protein
MKKVKFKSGKTKYITVEKYEEMTYKKQNNRLKRKADILLRAIQREDKRILKFMPEISAAINYTTVELNFQKYKNQKIWAENVDFYFFIYKFKIT